MMNTHAAMKAEYFQKLDANYWINKIDRDLISYQQETDEKKRSSNLIEIYSIYLQLIEIFLINLAASSTPASAFIPNLFMSSKDIRHLAQRFTNTKSQELSTYIEKLQVPIIKLVNKKASDEEIEAVINMYKSLMLETMKDYLSDYELLNAYKHGFRVEFSSHDSEVSISSNGKDFHKLLTTDAQIRYYSREKARSGPYKGEFVFYDQSVLFNAERIFGKATFIYTLFESIVTKERQKADPTQPQAYRSFDVSGNIDKWSSSSSSFRSKIAVGLEKEQLSTQP